MTVIVLIMNYHFLFERHSVACTGRDSFLHINKDQHMLDDCNTAIFFWLNQKNRLQKIMTSCCVKSLHLLNTLKTFCA